MANLGQKDVELGRNESEIQLLTPSFKMSETSWEVVLNNLSPHTGGTVRTDMLTIQASGWNKRKAENLDRALAKRYIKSVQRIKEATKDLEKLTAELSLQQDTV